MYQTECHGTEILLSAIEHTPVEETSVVADGIYSDSEDTVDVVFVESEVALVSATSVDEDVVSCEEEFTVSVFTSLVFTATKCIRLCRSFPLEPNPMIK